MPPSTKQLVLMEFSIPINPPATSCSGLMAKIFFAKTCPMAFMLENLDSEKFEFGVKYPTQFEYSETDGSELLH